MTYDLFKDDENRLWLVSSNSISYDRHVNGKDLVQSFNMRHEAFTHLNDLGLKPIYDDIDNGYYEIYI